MKKLKSKLIALLKWIISVALNFLLIFAVVFSGGWIFLDESFLVNGNVLGCEFLLVLILGTLLWAVMNGMEKGVSCLEKDIVSLKKRIEKLEKQINDKNIDK